MTALFSCSHVRSQLDAFIDGELSGAERAVVSHHLEACPRCVEEEQDLRGIGALLRSNALATPRVDLTGLASGVVSRVCAERAQSWPALFERAVEDWHWALVGAGSLTAGVASILFVSALLWFGPSPSRADSLEAVLNNLGAPAGTVLIGATDGSVRRFVSGSMDGSEEAVVVPVSFSDPAGPSEGDLTAALSEAMVGSDGRVRGPQGMSFVARKHTEALLDEIQRLRYPLPISWSGSPVGVQRLGLVTSTTCTAKAL